MAKIRWSTQVNAPCCPGEVVSLAPRRMERDERGQFVATEPKSYLPQTDFEYPSVAQNFGWNLLDVQIPDTDNLCQHKSTDGTVDCRDCGLSAGDFISAAYDWLCAHDGAMADDPGYFVD